MKMGLHTYANRKLLIKLEPEDQTEKNIIEFFFGKSTQTSFQGTGDSLNGLFIHTGKTLK